MKKSIFAAGLGLVVFAGSVTGQQPIGQQQFFLEGRGGAVVPTFDISDVATRGGSFGATLGYYLTPNWFLMGEFDYGLHEDDPTGLLDINTLHYLGKVGYSFTGPRERGWEIAANLGVGAVTFDVETEPDTFTYFAINAGAKLVYHVNRSFAVVLSPQGDIAFSDEDEVATSNSWVWPFTAGARIKF